MYHIEMTDTFGGEANYSWVRRAELDVPDTISRLALVRRIKAAMGLNGVRCRMDHYGDTIEIRPHNACVVVFAVYSA